MLSNLSGEGQSTSGLVASTNTNTRGRTAVGEAIPPSRPSQQPSSSTSISSSEAREGILIHVRACIYVYVRIHARGPSLKIKAYKIL